MTQTTDCEITENKMGVLPIPKLIFQMSFPIMISMLVQALYNIIDSIFVARIDEQALTAISLAFPIQTMIIAVSVGTGVGVNALLSRHLGEKNYDRANETGRNGIYLAVVSAIIYAIIANLIMRPFISFQTNDSQIFNYTITYLSIVCTFCFACFVQIMLERILQSTGLTIYTMISQGTGAVVNIILDPIFIFGLFGFPKMGIAGAAIATVAGQMCGMFLAIYFNIHFNKEVNLNMRKFRPNQKTIWEIYQIGIPSIIMQSINSVMTFGMNKILIQFTPTATAVFGVYFKINSFIFMPIFGLSNGLVPVVAYNYGAQKKKRIISSIRLSVCVAVFIMFVGLAVFWMLPTQLLSLFNASKEMIKIGVPALKIISLSFIFAGYCIVISSVFQALGNAIYSLINSILRQLVIILPAAYLLGLFFGLEAVWWSIPLAELSSLFVTTILFIKTYKEKVAPLS